MIHHPLVRPCVLECQPYVAGRPREEVQKLLGTADVVKLASNENPLGPSPLALEAVRRELPNMHYYPDDASTELRALLARHWQLQPSQVLVGNGSMQILELLCKTFVDQDEEVVTASPSFRVFGGLVRAAGGRHVAVPLTAGWAHDLTAMRAAIGDRTKMLIVCNPNNPTGTIVAPDDLRALASSIPPHVIFVLDEAYVQFTHDGALPDFHEILQRCPNCVVLRSFSKIYGLAGLRVGCALGSSQLIDYLERARMPFVVNRLAQAAAAAALGDDDFVRRTRDNNFVGMERMQRGLRELGLDTLPSQANFLAVRVGGDDRAYFEAMMRQGVIVFPGSATDMPGYVRVTVGLPHEVERFLDTTRRVLAS